MEPFADIRKYRLKVCSFAIHFVDKRNPWNGIFVGLSPNRFTLSFYAFTGTEDDDSTVKNTKAPLDFGSKIDVSRGIDQVDRYAIPVEGDTCGIDRDPALLFLFVEVGLGRTLVDFAHPMGCARIEKHSLGEGCFSRIDVRNDADVSNVF